MIRYTPPSRRTFLKLMGTAQAAALFAPLLTAQVAEAQTAAPLRYLSLLSYHGMVPELWTPKGTPDAPDLSFAGATLGPLAPYLAKLLVMRGLDFKVLYEQSPSATGHYGGPATVFTGSRFLDPKVESPSLDVFLAAKYGSSTAIRSIQLVNHVLYCGDESGLSYSASGERLPLLNAPLDIYNRLFAGFSPGGGTMVDPKLAGRRSLVSFWLADANRLRAKLAGAEQHKLDAHLAALHDIEQRLGQTTSPTPTTCALPPKPKAYTNAQLTGCSGILAEQLIPERTKLILDILVQALACDRTRFGSLSLWPGLQAAFGDYLGAPPVGTVHDNLAHQVNVSGQRAKLNQLNTWVSTMVAYLLNGMSQISENGGTLLDHSLILWGNELSDPAAHSNTDMPYVLMGGGNGALRMGRSLAFPSGTPHNKLLASVAQVFDPTVTGFGNSAYGGALSLT